MQILTLESISIIDNEKLVGIILKMKDDDGKKNVKITIKHGSPNIEKSYSFLDALQEVAYLYISLLALQHVF